MGDGGLLLGRGSGEEVLLLRLTGEDSPLSDKGHGEESPLSHARRGECCSLLYSGLGEVSSLAGTAGERLPLIGVIGDIFLLVGGIAAVRNIITQHGQQT